MIDKVEDKGSISGLQQGIGALMLYKRISVLGTCLDHRTITYGLA